MQTINDIKLVPGQTVIVAAVDFYKCRSASDFRTAYSKALADFNEVCTKKGYIVTQMLENAQHDLLAIVSMPRV